MTSGAGAHHGALGLAAAAAAGAHDGGGGHVHDASAVDDGEGYYRARTGELLGGRYQVLGTRGRGVFSSVLYCRDTEARVADDASAGGGGAGDDDSTLDEVFRQGGEVRRALLVLFVGLLMLMIANASGVESLSFHFAAAFGGCPHLIRNRHACHAAVATPHHHAGQDCGRPDGRRLHGCIGEAARSPPNRHLLLRCN